MAGGRETGMLDLYAERPDVENKFGKLSYAPGFRQAFIVDPCLAKVEFIDAGTNRVLFTLDVCRDHYARLVNFRDRQVRKACSGLSWREKLKMRLRTGRTEWMISLLSVKFRPGTGKKAVVPESLNANPAPGGPETKLLFFTHNFNYEGAPIVLYNIARGLVTTKRYAVTIVSPVAGPAMAELNGAGIRTRVFGDGPGHDGFPGAGPGGFRQWQEKIRQVIRDEAPGLVLVNVLFNWFIVNLAAGLKIPVIWMIHESVTFHDQQEQVPHFSQREYFRAFGQAAFVVFCSETSQEYYRRLNYRRNFRVIRNALRPGYAAGREDSRERAAAREKLHIQPDETVILNVGIIVEHKNQELLVKAARITGEPGLRYFLVGDRQGMEYGKKIKKLIASVGLEGKFTVVPETTDTELYYAAADVFVFTSTSDNYPLTVLEAMAYGLPIIATPINGVNEQVRFGINALKADYADPEALARQIKQLAQDRELRRQMGQSSREIFESFDSCHTMIGRFDELVKKSLGK